jgi:hypothetical protein
MVIGRPIATSYSKIVDFPQPTEFWLQAPTSNTDFIMISPDPSSFTSAGGAGNPDGFQILYPGEPVYYPAFVGTLFAQANSGTQYIVTQLIKKNQSYSLTSSIIDLSLAYLQNSIAPYIWNGTGAVMPSNTSLYSLLLAGLVNGGTSLPSSTNLYDSETWQMQATATLSQASPVQNTYYNILAATARVRLLYAVASVATTGETLQVKITIDGQAYTVSVAATAGSTYYVYFSGLTAAGVPTFTMSTTATPLGGSGGNYLEGRSIQVQVEKTTANGTGTITGAAWYQTR